MAQRSVSSFKATKNSRFADNTSGLITEANHRDTHEDVADSFLNKTDDLQDDDTFASASATKVPSSESVKAYADSVAGTVHNTDLKHFHADDWFYGGVINPSGWNASVSGAGAGYGTDNYGEDATEQAMGTLYASTGTTTTGYCLLFRGTMKVGLGASIRLRFRMALEALSDATDTYTFYCGLSDITAGNPNNGIFFRYTHGTNAGEFQGVCRAASVETTTDTNVAAGTTYKILGMTISADGTSAQFDIDGVNVGSAVTTNIPTGTNLYMFFKIHKSAGTTARLCVIDWHDLLITRTTAR